MKKLVTMVVALLLFVSVNSFAQTPAAATAKQETTHVKKDGTPDKRYKENKNAKVVHVKKDGTPDKRYKENRPKSSNQSLKSK